MKPTVLLVGNFLSSTLGARSVSEDLADQLAAAGWPVLTVSDKLGRIPRLLDMIRTVLDRRREYEVAHVEVYSGPAFRWAEMVCWLLRRLNKPYLLTLHGGNLPAFARRRPSRLRNLLRPASVVTTPSGYLHQNLRTYREDLYLLPNPINLGAYRFRERRQVSPKLIWLRAFHRIYNAPLAAKALALLADQFPDIKLTMIGPDKRDGSLQEVKAAADRLNVDDRLELTGAVPKERVGEWLNTGDIFLNTTNIDNVPISVLEAMACGLCIVSTNVGGIPYLLEHERDALLVPPDDPAAMAAAVRRILTDSGLAASLSREARRKAEQWDWSAALPQWEKLLLSTLNSNSQNNLK